MCKSKMVCAIVFLLRVFLVCSFSFAQEAQQVESLKDKILKNATSFHGSFFEKSPYRDLLFLKPESVKSHSKKSGMERCSASTERWIRALLKDEHEVENLRDLMVAGEAENGWDTISVAYRVNGRNILVVADGTYLFLAVEGAGVRDGKALTSKGEILKEAISITKTYLTDADAVIPHLTFDIKPGRLNPQRYVITSRRSEKIDTQTYNRLPKSPVSSLRIHTDGSSFLFEMSKSRLLHRPKMTISPRWFGSQSGLDVKIDQFEFEEVRKTRKRNDEVAWKTFSIDSLIKHFEKIYSKRGAFAKPEERIGAVRQMGEAFQEWKEGEGRSEAEVGEIRKFLVLSFAHMAVSERKQEVKRTMLTEGRALVRVPKLAGDIDEEKLRVAKEAVDSAVGKAKEAEAALEAIQDATDSTTVAYLATHLEDEKISLDLIRKLVEILAQGENPIAMGCLMKVIENHNDTALLRMAEIGIKRILKHSVVDKDGLLSKKR